MKNRFFRAKVGGSGVNLAKITRYAILTNACQIVAALLAALYVLFADNFHLSGTVERVLAIFTALVVIYGAFLDIREAYSARETVRQREMLEDANRQLEELNGQLRAQRHDFMNHIQVIYSLTELEDRDSALEYMDTVYQNLQKVSRALKTASPAVNALIAAKLADCEGRGVNLVTDIRSDWQASPLPAWEMCRVLGNLIDNALDALEGKSDGQIAVRLWEDVKSCHFAVENNGSPVPERLREKIFESGFSTKGESRGMGLHIVRQLLERCGGSIELESSEELTRFHGTLPRRAG